MNSFLGGGLARGFSLLATRPPAGQAQGHPAQGGAIPTSAPTPTVAGPPTEPPTDASQRMADVGMTSSDALHSTTGTPTAASHLSACAAIHARVDQPEEVSHQPEEPAAAGAGAAEAAQRGTHQRERDETRTLTVCCAPAASALVGSMLAGDRQWRRRRR